MTTDINKLLLSGSTNGKMIPVAATSTPGTLIHTAQTGTAGKDEIWLWANNIDTAAVVLTIEYGGTAAGDQIIVSIPSKSGKYPVIAGELLQNGLVVRAFAASANKINLSGFVNKITD
jgi:hypothetical protein